MSKRLSMKGARGSARPKLSQRDLQLIKDFEAFLAYEEYSQNSAQELSDEDDEIRSFLAKKYH